MTKEAMLTAEVAVLTELVRVLSDKVNELEAKQEQGEPVAWRAPNWGHSADDYVYRDFDDPVIGADGKPSPNNEPLYTTPQQRTWVGLMDEEIWQLATDCTIGGDLHADKFARAIEAKLKENT
jgi:hypothetical protein